MCAYLLYELLYNIPVDEDSEFEELLDALPAGEPLTFRQVYETYMGELPNFDEQTAELIRQHPELATTDPHPKSGAPRTGFRMGRIVAISLFNFLCKAYGLPEGSGYVPPAPPSSQN